MAAMQSLKLPKNFILTLAVTLRFFPIIKMENDTIQMFARLRGLSYSQSRNWLRPLQAFECTFVPLMMRTMKITDELTAAAMTKGMDHPGQRTSIYQTRLTSRDLLVVVLFIGYAICIFTFNFLEV
jgi:energy-coupling factor transport system permease protein